MNAVYRFGRFELRSATRQLLIAHLEALRRTGAQRQTVARGRALRTAAHLAYLLGHTSVARAFAEESLALSRALGDRSTILYVLELQAAIVAAADPAGALRLQDESMTIGLPASFSIAGKRIG